MRIRCYPSNFFLDEEWVKIYKLRVLAQTSRVIEINRILLINYFQDPVKVLYKISL